MKWLLRGFTILAFLLMVAAASAATFTLVKNGKPACCIVTAEKPSDNARLGAKELQTSIEKISGARLEIYTDADANIPTGSRILVGRSRLTDAIPDLKIPEGITPAFREEGYIVRSTGDTLVLAGNDTEVGDSPESPPRCTNPCVASIGNAMYLGTRYAVCDLLNRLGVRWFMPGEYGEVVPKSANLRIPELSLIERPDFPMRSFFACGADGQAMTDARELWMVRNRMNPRSEFWFGLPGDGSIFNIMPRDRVKVYPEWFALQPDGTRLAGMPCMSDELRRNDPKYAGRPRLLDPLMEWIGKDVEHGHRVTSFSPDDGTPTCECDLCRQKSTRFSTGEDLVPGYLTSQEYFFFVNGLLDAMGKKYPGHIIATNGYANRCNPPEVGPEFNRYRNLTIMFADITGCTLHRFNDPKCWQNRQQYNFLKRWSRLSDKVWCYNYNYTMLVTKGTLTPMVKRIRTNIPLVKEAGSIGFCDQDWIDILQLGIPTYVARFALEWNTKVNLDAVLDDFYSKWFGPAAVPMRNYYETLQNAFDATPCHGHEDVVLPAIYDPKLMAQLADDMARAEAAADTDTEKLHVRVERLMYDHLRLYVDSLHTKQECRFRDAAVMMRQMLALKLRMRKISKHMGWNQTPYGMDWEAERMDRLARMEMLAPLPETARFRFDKNDVGRSERWMEADYNDRKWQTAKVDSGWQDQDLKDDDGLPSVTTDGHPYKGVAWYRFMLDVPTAAQGKQAHLFCPAVTNEAWVWVNGHYVGRNDYQTGFLRPHEMDADISPYLKPGKNVIALRVLSLQEYFGANGIYERPFLYVK
ncbi:MAG: DUF4838 domain-containing protein [Armatimonadota bacterium]|nr:DUF4838 domain-containing protein [Armatimonadota bacterium]